jgi:hypothetical protein
MRPLISTTSGQEQSTWTVTYEVQLVCVGRNATYSPEPLTISCNIAISGTAFSASIPVEGNLSIDSNITGTAQVEAEGSPNYARLDYLWVDKPVYIASMFMSQRYYGLYDWVFARDGAGYRFTMRQRTYRGFSYVTGGEEYSSVMVIADQSTKQAHVNVTLTMARASLVPLDFSEAYPLMGQIEFETPSSFMLSMDNSLAMLPPWSNSTALTGSYVVHLPALPDMKVVEIPISVDVSVAGSSHDPAGTRLLNTLVRTARDWLAEDERFFRDTMLDDPETMGRIDEARGELERSEQLKLKGDLEGFGFLLGNALKLTTEVRESRNEIMFFALYVIAPVVISFLLVAAALIGHLAFNGKASYIAGIFLALLAVSVLSHPALRVYVLSTMIEVRTVPSMVITFVLVGAVGYVVFKRAGAQTVYGLAFSTSMRMIKARKLRGFLSLLAVVVVAASVVPSVTLKGTSPVLVSQVSSATAVPASWAFAKWSVKFVTSSGESKSEGLRPLYPGEASYLANAAGMERWTSLSVARGGLSVGGETIEGSFIVADVVELASLLGASLERLDPDLSRGLLLSRDLGPVDSTSSVEVNGRRIKVVGLVTADSIFAFGDRMSVDLLLKTLIWRGGLSMFGVSASAVGGPFLGVVDSRMASQLGLAPTELAVVGRLKSGSADQVTADLQSLTLATRDWLTYANPEAQTYVEAVLTYEFDVATGSSANAIYAALPVTIAAGNWGAQLILMGIGGLIVMNVLMNSVVERRREAITMSSIGASPSFVTNLFIAEGVTLGALGGCIGYGLGYAASAWLGVSSTAVKAELYSLTPLVLVLFISMLTASLGSILPARSAILRIVPSKEILKREVGEIRFDPSGDALISLPIRIKSWEWKKFSEFMQRLVNPPTTSYAYGLWIMEYHKVNSIDRLIVDYTAFSGALAERKVTYDVDVRQISTGEFVGVELKVSGHPEWTDAHRLLLKDMLYALKDQLIRFTVDRVKLETTPEEEIEDIEEQLAKMRAEKESLERSLAELEMAISTLKDREAELRDNQPSPK